jgi:integrase
VQYRLPGSRKIIQASTGTSDVAEAKRFLHERLAEDPKAYAQRIAARTVTVSDALVLYEHEAADREQRVESGQLLALRHELGAVPLADLTRADLDALCRKWRSIGVDYPGRDTKRHRVRPITGTSCNRAMALLHRARTLAVDKLGVDLPRLTFPHFREEPAGRYVSPGEFYAILAQIAHPTRRAFLELLYLLGIRPGQLRSTETSNVRIENGKPVALVYRPNQVKQRTPHEVPLVGVGRAEAIVHALWRGRALGCKFLFHVDGGQIGTLHSEFRRACVAAGLKAGRKAGGIVMYNLRHSCLTNLAAAGVPDTTARAISGHRTDSAHRRYVITQSATKVAALAAMSEVVGRARQG